MYVKHFLGAISIRVIFAFLFTLSVSPFYGGTGWAQPKPLNEKLEIKISPEASKTEAKELTGVITLKDAISLARLRNPELGALSLEIRAQKARILQAGLLPNPEIGFEAENLGGSGDFRRFGSTETTLQLSQLIELGGKRSKRKMIAYHERDLAKWDYESKRADVLTEVTKAFVDVFASQEHLALTDELVSLAEKVFNAVSARVKAGKTSPVEETRAGITFSISRIALEHAKQKLKASRKQLAAAWGGQTPYFENVDGEFDVITNIPSITEIEGLIFQNPDLARWGTEKEQRHANLALEDARRIPDPTISLGARNFNETDDNAFILAVSIPIPVFDRNQGGTMEARLRLSKANKEHQAARMMVLNDLAEAYQSLSSAYSEATALKAEVLPGAQSAFDASREGYRQGKFDYLVLLDAQRTLFEVRARHIEALSLYHKAVADVERLIGTGLDTPIKTSEEKS